MERETVDDRVAVVEVVLKATLAVLIATGIDPEVFRKVAKLACAALPPECRARVEQLVDAGFIGEEDDATRTTH